jgi:uncharacterized protein DUF3667
MKQGEVLAGATATQVCANCGEPLLGPYCHRCGQRRVGDPLSLKALTGDVIANVVDIDHSKMWRSLRALLTRPGLLTREYFAGRRVDWITPLKLYLSIFALSFFLYSAFKSVAVFDLSTLLTADKTGALAKAIAQLAQKRHLAQEAFITVVNAKWHGYMSFAQFLYPLFFAVVLKLFYWRRRFVEQLVFSMHYQAFALLVIILAWPLYRLTGIILTNTSAVLAIAVTLVMMLYLIFAARAVYRESWAVSITKGVLLYFGYYLIYTATTYSMLALAIFAAARGS